MRDLNQKAQISHLTEHFFPVFPFFDNDEDEDDAFEDDGIVILKYDLDSNCLSQIKLPDFSGDSSLSVDGVIFIAMQGGS